MALLPLAACGGGGGGAPSTSAPPVNSTPQSGFVEDPSNVFIAADNSNQSLNMSSSTSDLMVTGKNGNEIINTGSGNDIIAAGNGDDKIDSGSGDDVINAGDDNDVINGGPGADIINGGLGSDVLTYKTSLSGINISLLNGTASGGDAEGDIVTNISDVIGTAFDDNIEGDGGFNILYGGAGDDTISGGDGRDRIYGGAGADIINGGADIDILYYEGSPTGVNVNLDTNTFTDGDAQGDLVSNIEVIVGSNFDDTITANATGNNLVGLAGADILNGHSGVDLLNGDEGNDSLFGFGGNDALFGGAGADHIDGGAGEDRVSYLESNSGVNINLLTGVGSGGHAQGDTLANIEIVTGSDFNDTLIGDDGNNTLVGRLGDNTLIGGNGDDRLIGGIGDGLNTMNGGNGNDFFTAQLNDIIDGGADEDTLRIGIDIANPIPQPINASFDLSDVNAVNIEIIELLDFRLLEMSVQVQDVLDVTDGANTLRITGDNDIVVLEALTWTQGADQLIDGDIFNAYTASGGTLFVEEDITVSFV